MTTTTPETATTTTTATATQSTAAPDYWREIPEILQTFAAPGAMIKALGLEPQLLHLITLRASQLNRCAVCLEMHLREARADGETQDRLDRLIVWPQSAAFSPREKAALAWTEALTLLDPRTEWAALRGALRAHFSDKEISGLTAAAALINLWNRIGASRH